MTDKHDPVNDYARLAARWWDQRRGGHGPACRCLACADHRAAIFMEPLDVAMPVMVAPIRRATPVGGR
jgi:hypothetical protein